MKRILILVLLTGCSSNPPPTASVAPSMVGFKKSAAAMTPKNSIFTEGELSANPRLTMLNLPDVPGGCAVWGATGRDNRGHVYFGISIDGIPNPSAHLLDLDPVTGTITDCGGVLEQLHKQGLAKPGEGQNKIHTKILQGFDRQMYFASMDESGEAEDGSKLPTFGSHLWRYDADTTAWQRIAHVPEAIIAAAVGGTHVYFLGYYGHVLYQVDTQTGRISNQVKVGSVGGHTTRNFIVDSFNHIFVPRVTKDGATLVEFDETLKEVATHPLGDYSTMPDSSSHGIVGVATLDNGHECFVTDRGRLYRLVPRETGTAVVDLGFIHPQGECYCASLFSLDGIHSVFGIGHRLTQGEPQYELIQFDLLTKQASANSITIPIAGEHRAVLVYGSITRDEKGLCYLGGRYVRGMNSIPAVWTLQP